MCGIAGIVSALGITNDQAEQAVRQMVSWMHTRGPDAEGVWAAEGVVLGHRRLAILDLDERSNQPMLSENGRYAISFNGEIYNFRELRRELEIEGVVFRTTSDTEVILALFARDGAQMLPRLRGMFALAIWDTQARELFLARDPYGIKPLYYVRTLQGFAFASQVKALLASNFVPGELEPAGLAGFYLWGSVPEPWTLYRGIYALPGGHWLRVTEERAETPTRWYEVGEAWQVEPIDMPASELQDRVRQVVTDSMRAHLVSDVPLSVFLSGGIDSGVVAGLASQLGAKVEGVTIVFDEFSGRLEDEGPLARTIASHYGISHYIRIVSRSEFQNDLPHILNAMDQPSIDGVNTWFASKAAAEHGYKVVLSGVGGDELFFGYSLFNQLPAQAFLGSVIASVPAIKASIGQALSLVGRFQSRPKIAGVAEFMGSLKGLYFLRRCLFLPNELPALMGVDLAREGVVSLGGAPPGMAVAWGRDAITEVGLLETTHYMRNQLLRDSDWASMAHSLELRTPLVDAKLLEALGPYVGGFAHGTGKKMLAKVPRDPLPADVMNRVKTGFGLPLGEWLSMDLHQNTLSASVLPGTPWARRWARLIVESMAACE